MATTWNPSDKSAGINLSGANLIATRNTSLPGFQGVRGTTFKTTGKWFWEQQNNVGTSSPFAGLMTGAASINSFPGGDTHGVGWQMTNGLTYFNGVLLV